MPRNRKQKTQGGVVAPGHTLVDKGQGHNHHNGSVRQIVEQSSKTSELGRLFADVSRGYQGDTGQRTLWSHGHSYASKGEFELAELLHNGNVLFKPHVILPDCPDQDNSAATHRFELDFAFFEPQKFPGMSEPVDGIEYKGILDDRALTRHESIIFKYHIRVLTAYKEHLDLWKREGLRWPERSKAIQPSQANQDARKWLDRMAQILTVTGVDFRRDVNYKGVVDTWATAQSQCAKFFDITADFVPTKGPIKVRGCTPYIDGIIVRTLLKRDDLEAIDALRLAPHRKRFIIATPTMIQSWYNGGLLSRDRIINVLKRL